MTSARGLTTITTRSEAETAACGRDLAATVAAGTVVLLVGDLGAGKTAFVRGMAQGLGIDPREVSSPTFTLVQEYRGGSQPLAHIDLYRLDDPREIEDLGIEDLEAGHVVAIEWAEKLPRPPRHAVRVRIDQAGRSTRRITIDRSDGE
jgi:tRNA threonylcarbamoyladenosine biosynthesis protein TsaE